MIGVGAILQPAGRASAMLTAPIGLGWDASRLALQVSGAPGPYRVAAIPRDLVDPGIWSGVAIHVDGAGGDDRNLGLAGTDGDFSNAKRTIHAAFTAGNAMNAPYRVIVKAGTYEESAFTRNGNVEPEQAVAIIGWDGPVRYRTGPFTLSWAAQPGGTHSTVLSSVNRAFRTDEFNDRGLYSELSLVGDLSTCEATEGTWFKDGNTIHVNIGRAPGAGDVALIRSFHGARFLRHTDDLYLENIHCEGGITGAFHCDPEADRNIVGVNCSFRYSSPSNVAAPLDAVRIRRTNGLVAFFDCDASGGAKDGWSFHEDGYPALQALLVNCSGSDNGAFNATSCNALTTHDAIVAAVIGGDYGHSRNGTEVHCIQSTRTWLLGVSAVARDVDGTSVAFKCSNASEMWLQNTRADAAGGAESYGIEANGGAVFTRGHVTLAGDQATSNGGSISSF